MSKRERTRAALLLVAVFVVGAVVGVAVDRVVLLRGGHMYPKRLAGAGAHRMLQRLDRDLELTAEQETAIKAILDRRAARLESVWKRVEPSMLKEIDQADAEIAAVLNPAQRAEFDAMKKKWRDRARRVLGRKPGVSPQ